MNSGDKKMTRREKQMATEMQKVSSEVIKDGYSLEKFIEASKPVFRQYKVFRCSIGTVDVKGQPCYIYTFYYLLNGKVESQQMIVADAERFSDLKEAGLIDKSEIVTVG